MKEIKNKMEKEELIIFLFFGNQQKNVIVYFLFEIGLFIYVLCKGSFNVIEKYYVKQLIELFLMD